MSVDSTAILKIKGLDRRCLSRIVIAFRLSFRLRPGTSLKGREVSLLGARGAWHALS